MSDEANERAIALTSIYDIEYAISNRSFLWSAEQEAASF